RCSDGFTVTARRSRTESWRWNDEIESAGRLSLRFWRWDGNNTAAQITARINSTKRVTLRACLWDSGTVTLRAEAVVDGLRSGERWSTALPPERGCYGSTTVRLRASTPC